MPAGQQADGAGRMLRAALLCAGLLLGQGPSVAAEAPQPSPHAIDIPAWFTESLLDLRDDVKGAAAQNKRLMVYFGQDGCPYCRQLMRVNFGQPDIVEKTRNRFEALALNIWGDREVTWIDGKVRSEKEFAAMLKVQFTPTLLFLDEKGGVVLRVNGYYPPDKFRAALDYASARPAPGKSFADYLHDTARSPDGGSLRDQPFFAKPPYRLNRPARSSARPLAVLFERLQCAECDEWHAQGFKDRETLALLKKFDVVRLNLQGDATLVRPDGRQVTEQAWARELNVAYTPTIVFFDAAGKEVFRLDGYVKTFHLASALDYVASGAYREQPSFQRYAQARGERIRAGGGNADLWK